MPVVGGQGPISNRSLLESMEEGVPVDTSKTHEMEHN